MEQNEKTANLNDELLDRIDGGVQYAANGAALYTVLHGLVSGGCGKTFYSETQYPDVCPLCNRRIDWRYEKSHPSPFHP